MQSAGYETITKNSNPETLSTDYNTSDCLYFEPSPVLLISGPRNTSQPGHFPNGITTSLTATCSGITRAAYLAKGQSIALETDGTVREEQGFTSSRKISPTAMIAYWQFMSQQMLIF